MVMVLADSGDSEEVPRKASMRGDVDYQMRRLSLQLRKVLSANRGAGDGDGDGDVDIDGSGDSNSISNFGMDWEGKDAEYLDLHYKQLLKGAASNSSDGSDTLPLSLPRAKQQQATLQEQIAEASKNLLYEMGTVRNVRRLNEIQRRTSIMKVQPLPNRYALFSHNNNSPTGYTTAKALGVKRSSVKTPKNPLVALTKSLELVPTAASRLQSLSNSFSTSSTSLTSAAAAAAATAMSFDTFEGSTVPHTYIPIYIPQHTNSLHCSSYAMYLTLSHINLGIMNLLPLHCNVVSN
jgi:hypothetical protein